MLDRHLRPLIDRPLDKAGRLLARSGVSANAVTVAGFAVGVAAMAALALQAYAPAAVLVVANRVLDGLDGAVARARGGGTDFGGFLDIVLDFIVYAGVVFAFAVGRPDTALAAAFLIFSYIGSGGSFLAYAIVAAKRGAVSTARGHKALYFVGGLAEGSETALFMLAICLFPAAFEVLAVLFAILCWLTAAGRVWAAWSAFAPGTGETPGA